MANNVLVWSLLCAAMLPFRVGAEPTAFDDDNEAFAQSHWRKTFAGSLCENRSLITECAYTTLSAICETYPKPSAGDGDCYELLEIIAFIPADQSSLGDVEWIGSYLPTW